MPKTTRRPWFAHALLSLVTVVASTSLASAQASRTWVSGVGDDANPCSRTAPCKTFAGAISKTAAGGEINAIDPGGYGAVTITKSITIDGAGTQASILASGTNGIVVNAGANDVVTIRNVSINGFNTGLNGIRFLAGAALHVENVVIFNFSQKGIDFQPSTTSRLFVRDANIRNNQGASGGGIFIKPAAVNVTASIEDTRLDANRFGIRAEDGSTVSIKDTIASNSINGFHAISTSSAVVMTLDSCLASNNTSFGVLVNGAAATMNLSNTTVTGNGTGLSAAGGINSFGNNRIVGNTTNGSPTSTLPQQ